jgi:hypothetical protein
MLKYKFYCYVFHITYGSEWWTLTVEGERVLAVYERKILRKIYGPVKKKTNYGEFDEMMN